MRLAQFGARADGGVDRQALSATETPARAEIVRWGRASGFRPFTDAAANLFIRFEGAQPDLPPVLAGSHIDSQPTGGKFDGAFGVLAALEAADAIRAAGLVPQRSIEVVAWTNEEGSRFAPGMTGSELFIGAKTLQEVSEISDADGVSFGEAVRSVLESDKDIPQRPLGRAAAAFLEPHIEQGPHLERAGIPIGVVSGIQGTRRYRVRVSGAAAHAGTAERHERKDALMAAVRMIAAVDRAASEPPDVKLTIGMLRLSPNAPSVVPEEAFFSIDLRHPDNAVVDRIDGQIRDIVQAEAHPCTADLQEIQHSPSLWFSAGIRALIARSADDLGIAHHEIYSAAGHDARQLHYVCPTGMIFIPCRDGISHNPAEWANPEDITAGARVLADVLWDLARRR